MRSWGRCAAAAAAGLLAAACAQPPEAAEVSPSSTDATTTVDDGGRAEPGQHTADSSAGEGVAPQLVGSTAGDWTLFPDSGNGGYDVTVNELDLALSDDLTALSGTVTITATATQDLQRFSLDARDLQVSSVTVDGTSAGFVVEDPELVVTTTEPIAEGAEFDVGVTYSAQPATYRSPGLPFPMGWDVTPGRQVMVHGFPDATATWLPTNADRAEPPVRYIFRLDVPEGFSVTASGVPSQDADGGIVWDTNRPVFGATFVVAELRTGVIDGSVPVEVSLPLGYEEREQFEAEVLDALAFNESLFGPFPYERLGVSMLANRSFAFSTPMRIVVVDDMPDGILVHEVAHQWIGNAVVADREDANWLVEGLATYVESLWRETRDDDVDIETTTATLERDAPVETRPLGEVNSVGDLLDAATYERGALLFHALRLEVGDEAFASIVRDFVQDNLHRRVGVEDLVAVAERVSGRDLDDFFVAWVDEAAVPALPEPASP